MYLCGVLWSSFPSVVFPFPSSLPLIPSQTVPIYIMSHCHRHRHHFRPRLQKWVRTCDNWPFEFLSLVYSLIMMISSSVHFPENDMIRYIWMNI
jgi:hypothetical protein